MKVGLRQMYIIIEFYCNKIMKNNLTQMERKDYTEENL